MGKGWRFSGEARFDPQVEADRVAKIIRMGVRREGRLGNQIGADRVTINESRAA